MDPLDWLPATPVSQLWAQSLSPSTRDLLPPSIKLYLVLPESHAFFFLGLHIHFGRRPSEKWGIVCMGWELVLALVLSLRLEKAREPQACFNITPGIHEFVTANNV